MRCLIVVPSLKRAGAETQAVDLANGLAARGHAVHLCAFESELDQRARLTDAVRFHHVRRKSKFDGSLIAGITEIIDREEIEVVQAVLQFALLLAWLASRRSSRQPAVVAALHTTINQGLKEELQDRLIYRWILRRLPAVVFVCNYQCDHWVAKYPELRRLARVVHNGIEIGRFRRSEFITAARQLRASLNIKEGATVFTCIAAFRPEKGHHHLIKAFAQLPTHTYLLLAGDGRVRPAIEGAVHQAGIGDRVRFLGAVPDVRPAIVGSNATVLPSTAVETFSIAMLESMALEVPMIASRIGGLEEAITHRQTGLICPPGDPDALAVQMRFVVEHPSEARELGIAACDRVARLFTFEKMVTKYEELLGQVLSSAVRN